VVELIDRIPFSNSKGSPMATTATSTTAADVMTPGPRTCSTYSTVLEAVLIFRDADCGAVPVLDDCKPVGLLTDRDVALALAEFGGDLTTLPVTRLMTSGVVAVSPGDSLETITDKFTDKAVRRLLVIDSQGQLVGIIAWSDIANFLSKQKIGEVVAEVTHHP
jgi:CBS domain-containing protein